MWRPLSVSQCVVHASAQRDLRRENMGWIVEFLHQGKHFFRQTSVQFGWRTARFFLNVKFGLGK